MAVLLYRWGVFAARRRRAVLAAWLVLMAAVIALGVRAAGEFTAETDIPGSQAQSALTEMNRHFPSSEHQSAQIVFETPEDATFKDPAMAEAMGRSLTAAATVPGVTSVTDPTASGTVSPDGRTAVAKVWFGAARHEAIEEDVLDALKDTAESSRAAGIDVLFGGEAYRESGSPGGPAEALGLLVALLVLAVTFGQLLSAGMPLLMAVLAVGTSLAALTGLAARFDIYEKAPSLALMLGLAVGIDYALFILARHRSELLAGRGVGESAARATATAGSAVAFAGLTVIIALTGLSITGVPALTAMGLSAALTVATSVVMSLFLMPALLSAVGGRLRPSADSRAARRERQAEVPAAKPPMGVRWAGIVVRHPWRSTVAVVLLLGALALPATQLRLALPDDGGEAASTAVRQSYDKVADAFGPGANGPLVVLVSDAPDGTLKSTGEQVAAELEGVDGVARLSPAEYSQDGAVARVQVVPETGPRDAETTDLVNSMQDRLAPLSERSGSDIAVTGQTAVSIEVSEKLSAALLPFAVVVVGLSLLLLLAAFRSVAIPVKATAGFLLSVGAALGVTVAVFQWGWLADRLGVPSVGPVSSFVPVVVMAILFGLAMDYEVFMVSAVREEYVRARQPRAAVIGGARHATRVVAAAALIMVAVFSSFLLEKDPALMPIALALAVGVALDAFLVRLTLVPAVLTLLGHRAWWLPKRLDKHLPDLDVEGARLDHDRPASASTAPSPQTEQDITA
ncbi:MMPL family transporter [Streptomyces sp. NPDC005263]|uniref:MMPL family transporter n=1 Tax=Streptomyces sp. NPDC005263 TaxID=3364711 RepID=UPI0036B83FA9